MSLVVLSSIETFDGDRCVDFFQRADGTFGFDEFRRDPETKTGWFRIGHFENAVFASRGKAIEAAKVRVVWLDGVLKTIAEHKNLMVRKKNKSWHWSQDVHQLFKKIGIKQVAYVPDGGLAKLIELCQADRSMRSVVLTTEEEGVAQMAGAWLGGQRGVLLTQSGGVGNCINMLSMIQECRIPLLAMVSMRGEWGETFPWQVPMGQSTIPALEAAKVIVHHVDLAEKVPETVNAAAKMAFDANRAVAVVISQRISGSGSKG